MNSPPLLLAASEHGPVLALPRSEQPTLPFPWEPIPPAKPIVLLASDVPTALGKEVRSLRLDLDLTQGEAGRAIGCRATSFILLESGGFTLDYEEQARAVVLLRAAGEAKRGARRPTTHNMPGPAPCKHVGPCGCPTLADL